MNIETLKKLAETFSPERLITGAEVDQILMGILGMLKEFKSGTESLNADTRKVVNSLLEEVVKYNQKAKEELDKQTEDFATKKDERMQEVQTLLEDVKVILADAETMLSEVKDGKDADEEKIVEDVVGRIKIDPTIITLSAEEVRDKLASLKDDARLDKSSIKGLEKILSQKDLDYAIATLQQQTSFLINKGGVKSIVAGTNITVDNTDPSNPVVSSTGGGSPGGSTTQLQYNNAGAFGGISGATTNGTAVTYTSNSLIGADINASSSAGFVIHNNTGSDVALFGAGSGTGATFYGGVNIASNLTVDTNTLFVDATNNIVGIGTTSPLTQTGNKLQVGDNSAANQYLVFQTNNSFERGIQYYLQDGTTLRGFLKWDGNEDLLYKGDEHWWSTGGVSNHMVLNDTGLGLRTSAPTHTLTLASTGTGIALYNTADQTTNYERVQMYWNSNTFTIQTQKAGTGTNRNMTIGTVSRVLQFLEAPTGTQGFYTFSNSTGGSLNALSILTTRSNSASVAAELTIQPIYNQSGTAGYTALLINPTETTTGSGTKLLADFQVGGSSKFSVSNTGIATHTNTVDAASNQVLVLQGDRATPAANDEIYQSFLMSSSTGVQREFARISTRANSVTNASEAGMILFAVINGGSLSDEMRLTATSLFPSANGGLNLGTTTNMWGTLFLNASGVINFNNGNATLTHSTGLITSNVPVAASQIYNADQAATVTTNAATITRAFRNNTFTNSSAAAMTITLSTTGATAGDMLLIQIYDFSAAAQTITWVNTENSTVSAPTTSNGSTTLPLTVGFKWNASTSKWRCIASA